MSARLVFAADKYQRLVLKCQLSVECMKVAVKYASSRSAAAVSAETPVEVLGGIMLLANSCISKFNICDLLIQSRTI